MSTTRTPLHPALWVAAASVTAVSLAGVAKLTGVLPEFGKPQPEAVVTAAQVAAEPVAPARIAAAEPAPVVAAEPDATPEAKPTPAPAAKVEHREPPAPPKHAVAKPHPKPAPASAPAVAQGNPPPSDAVPAPADAPPPGDHAARRIADAPAPPPVCRDCGVVENVEAIQQKGEGSGIGAVGGAILGGVLGHQIGSGSGNRIARIGGAVLGGIAGNEVERNYRTISHYRVTVRLDDGTRRVVEQQSAPSWHVGDAVRVQHGEIVSRGSSRPAEF